MKCKKVLGALVTAIVLVGCMSIPLAASPAASSKTSLQGKYLDSQFSQRAVNTITNPYKNVVTTATVTIRWGAGKQDSKSSWRKSGNYTLNTVYVYSKEIKSWAGSCSSKELK